MLSTTNLCSLTSYAEPQEVIHCDLKPENILISSLTACKIKVIDYGNAYLHHDQRCSYVQSRAYRAPEVVLGLPYSTKVTSDHPLARPPSKSYSCHPHARIG